MDYGYSREESQRMREGISTLRWYMCHNCGWEAWIKDGVRSVLGCGNAKCHSPCLHVHSDLDGEKPKTLAASG